MYGFISIAILSCCLLSCTDHDDIADTIQIQEQTSKDYTDLMIELENFNNDYQRRHPSKDTRSIFSRLWNAVKADFKGQKSPTTIFGITASISQSREQWKKDQAQQQKDVSEMESCSKNQKKKFKLMVDSLKNEYAKNKRNVGAIHNAAILSLFIDDEQNFSNTKQLVEGTVVSLKNLGVDTSELNISEVIKSVDTYFKEIDDPDDHVVFQRLRKIEPARQDELNILEHYFYNVQSLTKIEDIVDFTDRYVKIIDKSSITTGAKTDIISNITIAPASYSLWNSVLK